MKLMKYLLFAFGLSVVAASAEDKVIAQAPPYAVILRTEDDGQSASAFVCKEGSNGYVVLGSGENVVGTISNCVPEDGQLPLAVAFLKTDIEKQGGVQQAQADIDAVVSKYGTKFSPLAVEAYRQLGIKVKGGSQ